MKACETCGADARATVEILESPQHGGKVLMTVEVCRRHEEMMTADLQATYLDGSPAYRVDRHG